MSLPPLIVIALVSGKGGVGKTMLSVAVARELSLSNRTLIIDLDFFNRGLTGLMGNGEITCEIDKPEFLLDEQSEETTKWRIIQVAKNLFHIGYPDLLPEEMQRFETLDVNVLKKSLEAFIREASAKCKAECVVLDCHGGPDNSSFAACLFADYGLLISEPDRITFYGTLNFLRQLKRIAGDEEVHLQLVFNKVVPAFSGLFLRSLYNRLIREHFADRPLLAIFPLEVYLTKEFERTPFLTAVYPDSWLAKKSRTLLYDLLSIEHPEKLPPPVRSMPKWMRAYTKLTLGKQLPIFNMNVAMPTIVAVGVFLALLSLILSEFFGGTARQFKQEVAAIRVLECVHESDVLKNDRPTTERIINDPDSYPTIFSELAKNKLQEQGIGGLNTVPNPESTSPHTANDPEQDIKGLLDFGKCIYPNATAGASFRSDSEDYHVFTKRRQVLNSLKPERVPPEYQADYQNMVNGLRNTNRGYLLLQTLADEIFSYPELLAALATGWLALVVLVTWSVQLDRRFTYYCRLRKFGSALVPLLVAIILWFFPLLIMLSVVSQTALLMHSGHTPKLLFAGSSLLLSILAILWANETVRVYRDLRYEGNYLEDGLRALFLTYFALGPIVIFFLSRRGSFQL